MTAKTKLSATTAQKEATYQGAGTGTVYKLLLQEQPDTSGLVTEDLPTSEVRSSLWDAGGGSFQGRRTGALDLQVNLAGLGTNAGGAITNDNDGALIEAAIGTSSGGTGTTCAAGWTATSGDVTSAAGLAEGEMVAIETSAGIYAAMITDITSSTLTVDPPLPAAPAESAKVYAGVTYFPSATRGTWILEHHRDAAKIAYKAVGVGFTPEFSNLGAQEGMARLTLKGSLGDWSKIASTLSSAAAPDTFTGQGVVQDKGRFVLTDGSDSVLCIAGAFSMSSLLTEARRAAACEGNAIGEPEILPSADKRIEVELWQPATGDDPIDQLETWRAAGTKLQLVYQIGRDAGDMIAFYFPAVYLAADPRETDKNGMLAIKTSLKISLDVGNAVLTLPWYFARF